MHRDVVTHVAVSTADFFITGSADGKLTQVVISLAYIACVFQFLIVFLISFAYALWFFRYQVFDLNIGEFLLLVSSQLCLPILWGTLIHLTVAIFFSFSIFFWAIKVHSYFLSFLLFLKNESMMQKQLGLLSHNQLVSIVSKQCWWIVLLVCLWEVIIQGTGIGNKEKVFYILFYTPKFLEEWIFLVMYLSLICIILIFMCIPYCSDMFFAPPACHLSIFLK